MRQTWLFVTGRLANCPRLTLIALLLIVVLHIPAFAFVVERQPLAEWHTATLHNEQTLIKNKVRVYRKERPTANKENQPMSELSSGVSTTNNTAWPLQTGSDGKNLKTKPYGSFYPEDQQDDYFNHLRPPFQPDVQHSDVSLTLLPVLRLGVDCRNSLSDYLPGANWLHWLLGEPDYASGITVIVRFGDQPPIVVQVAEQEYQHMVEYLADPKALLYWLAPRIQGRDTLVYQLLALLETMTMRVNEPVREAIQSALEYQLAEILEQPGILVDVALEQFSLQRTLKQFIECPHGGGEQQSGSLKPDGEQKGEENSSAGNTHHPGKPDNKEGDAGRNDNGQSSRQPSGSQTGAPENIQTEAPYFTLSINRQEYRVARKQLNPEKRGQENAAEIHAYKPDSLTNTWPLTELEQQAGVRQALHLPETDQKPLSYLTTYGTQETRQALHDFYPVDVLQITEGNHLEAAASLNDEQLDSSCVFCMESMLQYRGAIRTDCQHVFHLPCLIENFRKQPPNESGEPNLICPSCRRSQTRPGQLLYNEAALSQELLHASEQGFETVVRALLEARVSSDAADLQGYRALHKAALANNLGVALLLIGGGTSVDQTDNQGFTAVDLASMSGHRAMVETLSAAIGVSPVFYWVAYGFSEDIKQWIERGEDLENTRNSEGSTLLHIAAARGRSEIAEQLLDYAQTLNLSIIDCLNNNRQTPLCAACDNGQTAVARLLLSCGASPAPEDADSPLILGAKKGCLEVVQLLLQEHAEHYQDDERVRALVAAARNGHHETAKTLMVGIEIPLGQWGEQILLEASRQGHWQVVSMLLDAGLSGVNILKQALNSAAENQHIDTVRLLLDQEEFNLSDDKTLAFNLLLQAVDSDQPDMIKLLLQHGASVNQARKGDGATALIRAADHGYLNVVKVLLEYDADVNQATEWHLGATTYTPLELAVRHGHNEVIKVLLENGAKVTSKLPLSKIATTNYQLLNAVLKHNVRAVGNLLKKNDNLGTGNALYYAARAGLIKTATLLLKHHADPNHVRLTEGDTPLHGAAKGGHDNLVQLLLENKADPTTANIHSESALDIASRNGNINIVTRLTAAMQSASSGELKSVLSMNAGNALYHSAANNQYDIVEWLLKNKADPNSAEESSGGVTPLHAAARYNHGNIIQLLLKYGADPDKTNNNNKRPLDIARQYHHQQAETELLKTEQGRQLIEAIERGDIQQAGLLLQGGADPEYRNDQKQTPLHLAVTAKRLDLVNLILQYSYRPDLSDGHYTPLHLAAINGSTDIAESLLQAGADPVQYTTDAGQRDEQPLHIAARGEHHDMVRLLRGHPQVDINGFTGKQRTALHIAAQAGLPEIVSLLLEFGAEFGLQDSEGNTLLHLICREFTEGQLKPFFEQHQGLRLQLLSEIQTNSAGETPLTILSSRRDIEEQTRETLIQELKK